MILIEKIICVLVCIFKNTVPALATSLPEEALVILSLLIHVIKKFRVASFNGGSALNPSDIRILTGSVLSGYMPSTEFSLFDN